MSEMVLPLFPFDSSALTVTTTVWIGALVCVAFNLRLGWTLSGLVIPGYLTPLLMTRPVAVAVILVESILVYALARLISEWPRKLPFWSSFFGRDRFFFIMLLSICVRTLMDGFLLPHVGAYITHTYGTAFDFENNLHSFGLIVVALIANYFWKPGLRKGLTPMLTCVAITYGIVNYFLVPHTNFAIGNLYLIYEDITSSLLASPKAYILVITTAYLASWINLRYAWDFNGILIPALLGLLWHEPFKILISGVECVVVWAIGNALLKTPLFQKVTIEGGRKISFFFTVCYVYRWLLCLITPLIFPELTITDVFGYGFLLTTLIAIKIHDKKRSFAVLFGTAQVSMLGAVAGSTIGFLMLYAPSLGLYAAFQSPSLKKSGAVPGGLVESEDLLSKLREDKRLLYETRSPESFRVPNSEERRLFRRALGELRRWCLDAKPPSEKLGGLQPIISALAPLNYELQVLNDRYVCLRECSPVNGWGIYLIDTAASTQTAVQVPAPLEEWSTVAAGLCVLQHCQASTLAIAGTKRDANRDGSSDVLSNKSTLFSVFHDVFARSGILQIRGYTKSGFRRIATAENLSLAGGIDLDAMQSRMYVSGGIPEQVSLADLRSVAGPFEVLWNESPFGNVLRETSPEPILEWFLSKQDRRRLISNSIGDVPAANAGVPLPLPTESLPVSIVPLREYLVAAKDGVLRRGSNQYRPATVYQMLYLDNEVVGPILEVIGNPASIDWDQVSIDESADPNSIAEQLVGAAHRDELLAISRAAGKLQYELELLYDPYVKEAFVVLKESGDQPRGWGTYLFRFGLTTSIVVEVPRPLMESHTWEFGVYLFSHPRGSVLSLAGADPRANTDGTADVTLTRNRTALFNLVRHALLRDLGERPFVVVQARALSSSVNADIVISGDSGAKRLRDFSALKQLVLNQFIREDQSVVVVGGQRETAGYELGTILRAATYQLSSYKEAMCLWLSPELRTQFLDPPAADVLAAQLLACDIETIHADLADELVQFAKRHPTRKQSRRLPPDLAQRLTEYIKSHDVVSLYDILRRYPEVRWRQILDRSSGQAFLWIEPGDDSLPIVANLVGALSDERMVERKVDDTRIRFFIRRRARWLLFQEESP